jgi:hypothetical protein
MHPWMRPSRETRLWPHESGPIYAEYDRLFDCRRHGWANLQSVHLNLPFADEAEFARLMAAIRLVLPLIPALAASSPFVEGRSTGLLDNRLEAYRHNAERTPAMAGEVIPEPVYDYAGYRAAVLAPIRDQLAGIGAAPVMLGREWTNARGAIARFDRNAIEIRLIDAQECPRADLAVAAAVAGAVRMLVEERGAPTRQQRTWPSEPLVDLLGRTIASGPEASLEGRGYAALFGEPASRCTTAGALWEWLVEQSFAGPPELEDPLAVVLRHGTLAQRLLAAIGPDAEQDVMRARYRDLCACLADGSSFLP